MLEKQELRFFLDSGAYSAWSRKAEVDLDEYMSFIMCNIEHIDVYANLDVIPGELGKPTTAAQREAGAVGSYANYLRMVDHGLRPLPVFHIGEDWKWLDIYIERHGCDYIGLGGLVGQNAEARRTWLDEVFDRICDAEGRPSIKTHGFGMTSIPLIFRYPWHSVDSTTWIKMTANGAIMLPHRREDRFVFDVAPAVVAVSNQNPNAEVDGKHASSFGPRARAALDLWLAECGVTYAQVEESYYHRAVCNVRFFTKVSGEKAERRFQRPEHRRVALW